MTEKQEISRARKASTGYTGESFLIINPDYPEQGKPFAFATDVDLDTFYGDQNVEIIAVFSDGLRVDQTAGYPAMEEQ